MTAGAGRWMWECLLVVTCCLTAALDVHVLLTYGDTSLRLDRIERRMDEIDGRLSELEAAFELTEGRMSILWDVKR